MSLLSNTEIQNGLSALDGWEYVDGSIKKTFSFDTYMDSIEFINSLAKLAESHNHHPEIKIGFVGSHTSALPMEVLSYSYVDFVFINEGVYALNNLLKTDLKNNLQKVKGIGFKDKDNKPLLNPPSEVVSSKSPAAICF